MMDLNLDELESAPARKSGRSGFLLLVIGIAIGVAGTLLAPRYVTPLLPESLRGGGEQVDGVVLAMGRDGDKLLITVDTQKGAVLSTFTRQVAEVELLVRVGDTLTLGLDRYDPFVSDPAIAAVRKNRANEGMDGEASVADALPDTADLEGTEPLTDTDADPVQADTTDVMERIESGIGEIDSGSDEIDSALPATDENAVEQSGAAAD